MFSIYQKILLFSLFSLLNLTACSSKNEIISISELHPYNKEYGVVEDPYADAIIEQEILSIYAPPEVETPVLEDPTWTTKLTKDPDAFYAEEYVPTPEIISYKYPFDPNFYPTAEWRVMDLE